MTITGPPWRNAMVKVAPTPNQVFRILKEAEMSLKVPMTFKGLSTSPLITAAAAEH